MKTWKWFASASAVALTAAITVPAQADVSIDDIVNDAATAGDVVSSGIGPKGQRYSTLTKVNKDNVGSLVPAWAMSLGGEKMRGQETQPLVKDGVMYITGSYSRAWAIDVKTGREIWQYDHRLPEGILPCCDVVNRGGALFGDKFIFGTLDAKLVALSAKTGKVVWSKKIDDFKAGFSSTAAPLIVPSKAHGPILVTGVSGGEFGIVGRVEARKVDSGEIVWSRPTIEGHVGTLNGKPSTMTGKKNETWKGDLWKTGGGATWLGGTYDPDTKLIFIGTGNPAPWNSHMRPGDNRWSCARIAIDPETGNIKWGFQTTPHDGWDYDGVNEVVSFDLNGTKAAATADRNGFFYVLDRTNGKFIRGFPFVSKISWASGLDDNGRPKYVKENYPGNPTASKDGKKGKAVFAIPSFLGGKNWMPMAYNKDTKLFYVPSNEWGMDLWNEPVTYKKGAAYLGAGFTIKPIFDDHIGALKAVDPASGKIVWSVKSKTPLWGGVMTTAAGLVFYGTPEGDFKALDASSGKELWSFNTGSGIVGSPITWEQDGQQYITVVSGWGGAVPLWGGEVAKSVANLNQGGMVWTFKLPKTVAAN
ncbi:MAG: PQQ-dependent methanol/ethanol family dehydrogenase [Alphaproteobacteria bacterium]|nr:PQQ-dependent methanol/ethanol family dehydrogenase [Alphaproteobacteria bacterium]